MLSVQEGVYQEILSVYIRTYSLQYASSVDPGSTVLRKCLSDLDIDLRINDDQLLLQFWTCGFSYVFKWLGDIDEFSRIAGAIKYDEARFKNKSNVTECAIHVFMKAILVKNLKYTAIKYGLK